MCGAMCLVKCPKCGAEVKAPVKTWELPRRGGKRIGEPKQDVGLYECPQCKARFRAGVEKVEMPAAEVSIKSTVEKIKGIRGELMQTLKNLREKIKTLETERSNLLLEIEELKKVAESKVSALESEVSMLREEVKSLKEMLGYSETEEEK